MKVVYPELQVCELSISTACKIEFVRQCAYSTTFSVSGIDMLEAKSRTALQPRLSKISTVPLLNLTPLNPAAKSEKQPKAPVAPKKVFEEYRPRSQDHISRSSTSSKERITTLKQTHLATLQSKFNRSFHLGNEAAKGVEVSQSVSVVQEREYEIDKLLLQPSHPVLHFPLNGTKPMGVQGKSEGKTLKSLIHAVLSNLPRRVKPMLDNCPTAVEKARMVMLADQYGRTALHYASFLGYLPVCEKLLSAGSNFMRRDQLGRTPLHYAAIGGSEQIISLLVQRSSVPLLAHHHRAGSQARPTVSESTALSKADLRDFSATLQEMNGLVIEADLPSFRPIKPDNFIDAQDLFSRTPLHYAVLTGNLRCIKILCGLGANAGVQDCEQRRPGDCAEHQTIKKFFKSRVNVTSQPRDSE